MSIFDKCCPIPKTILCLRPGVAVYFFGVMMMAALGLRSWFMYTNDYSTAHFGTVANAFFAVTFYGDCFFTFIYIFGTVHYMSKSSRKSVKKSVACYGNICMCFLFTLWLRYVITAAGLYFYYSGLVINIAITYLCLLVLISGISYGNALETQFAATE